MPDGSLHWEGVPIAPLAQEKGTPFFLFGEERLLKNLAAVRTGLEAAGVSAEIRYCAKSNSELGLQQVFASAESSVLASTAEEVALAVAAGFPPDRIAYQRPVLGPEVAAVLAAGVLRIHAYRISDIEILEQYAAEIGVQLLVSLRIRDTRGGIRLFGAAAQRLGFAPDEAVEASRLLAASSRLELDALNSYIGTQQQGLARFSSSIRLLGSVAENIRRATGQEVAELNIGGGIPSDTLRRISPGQMIHRAADRIAEPRTTLVEFSSAVGEMLRSEIERVPFIRRVAAEPGRSLVGNAGVLVTRVAVVQGNWLFVDASRNVLCESPLLFNRRIDVEMARRDDERNRFYNISGPTLNTLDVIDWRRRLPSLERGDLLVFSDAGAYSLSRAARYAGLCPPAYLIKSEREVRLIRRAETLSDLTGPMVPLTGTPDRETSF
ncbi:MAG TPA: hypothetical protein VMS12_06125 [Thermoanaerobaculia bacterium]|nr:hypothetical protein [Thermoanaerobaculia bacterium]